MHDGMNVALSGRCAPLRRGPHEWGPARPGPGEVSALSMMIVNRFMRLMAVVERP